MLQRATALLLLGCLLLAAAPQPAQSFRLLGYEVKFNRAAAAGQASTASIPAAQTPETLAAKKAQAAQVKGAAQSAILAAAGQEPVAATIQATTGSPEVKAKADTAKPTSSSTKGRHHRHRNHKHSPAPSPHADYHKDSDKEYYNKENDKDYFHKDGNKDFYHKDGDKEYYKGPGSPSYGPHSPPHPVTYTPEHPHFKKEEYPKDEPYENDEYYKIGAKKRTAPKKGAFSKDWDYEADKKDYNEYFQKYPTTTIGLTPDYNEDYKKDDYKKDDYKEEYESQDFEDYYKKKDTYKKKEDYKKDDYKKDDYKKDDHKKDDYKKDDYKEDEYKKDKYKKDDYKKDDYKKEEYKKEEYKEEEETYKKGSDKKEVTANTPKFFEDFLRGGSPKYYEKKKDEYKKDKYKKDKYKESDEEEEEEEEKKEYKKVDEYKKDKYKKETDEYKEYVNSKKKYVEHKEDKYHKDSSSKKYKKAADKAEKEEEEDEEEEEEEEDDDESIEADAMSKKVSPQAPQAKAVPEAKQVPQAQPSYAGAKHHGFFDEFTKKQQDKQPTYKMPDHLWNKGAEKKDPLRDLVKAKQPTAQAPQDATVAPKQPAPEAPKAAPEAPKAVPKLPSAQEPAQKEQPGQPNTLEGLWNQELKKIVSDSTGSPGAPRLPVPTEEKEGSKSAEAPAEADAKAQEAKPLHRHKEGEVQAEPEVLLRKGGKYASKYTPDTTGDKFIEDDDEAEDAYNKASSKKGSKSTKRGKYSYGAPACQQQVEKQQETVIMLDPYEDEATITSLEGSCSDYHPGWDTLGGGCDVLCDHTSDLLRINLFASKSMAFGSTGSGAPVQCSYRADAPMKGKCRVVMTLGCCADGGDGKPASKSPYKAQDKYNKAEAPKYEAEETPKYGKGKEPVSDSYSEHRHADYTPPLLDEMNGKYSGPKKHEESDYGRDKHAYGKGEDEYERPQPKYAADEDKKEYDSRHRDQHNDEAYAPKPQKPDYFDDYLGAKQKQDKQQRKVAADYEPKADGSESYRSYESEHDEAPRNPAEYEPRQPEYEEKRPESPYGEEKKEEKEEEQETPKDSDDTESDVPVVRYDPEEEDDDEAPNQPKNKRYEILDARGSKGIRSRPTPLPAPELRKNIDTGASRSPHVRGPSYQKSSQKALEEPEVPQPRSQEPIRHVQVPKLQQPQEQPGRRLPTASQVPSRVPAPSMREEHKGPQKITELPVFDAFRVKSDTDWLAEAEKQMSTREEEPARQPQPQQPKAVQPEPAKQVDKPSAQPAPAPAPVQKPAEKPQPKQEEAKQQAKAEPAPAPAKEAPKQPAPAAEQKTTSQAPPAAQAAPAAAAKPSGASARTA